MGSTHFLIRTLKRVDTEKSLQVLAYNMKRVTAILGVRPLVQAHSGLTVLSRCSTACGQDQRHHQRAGRKRVTTRPRWEAVSPLSE